ncbi:hypothetical protein LTR49_020742 [Elasticomyces elasticus]|nr:hypothetical protein LTR49_020742 [Elasticomyces elasticus]KAK5751021.1 hypothetical protein LTS12_018922 [Elasticomyces elasticus]
MASGYKELASEYQTKMQKAEARCFKLENALAAYTQAGGNVKTEEDVVTQSDVDALIQRNQDLEDNATAYARWVADLEKKTQVPYADVATAFCDQRDALEAYRIKLENATSIEGSVRKQAKNYENKWKQAQKLTETTESQRDKAQGRVKKLEADLFREKLNTKNMKDLTSASSPSAPVAATSSSRKRRACEDQDDEELDIKIKPRSAPETPVKQAKLVEQNLLSSSRC